MRVLRAAGIAVAAVVSVLFAAPAAGAATCNFTTPIGGTWEGGTWSCGHVPTAGDDVVLDSGDNVTVSTADAVAGTVTVTSSATLTVASLHKLDVSVATVVGAGTLAGPGTINAGSLSKTLAGQLSLDGGVTVRPQLDSSWTAGDICITNGSTLRFEHELDVAVGAGSFNCSSNDSLVQVAQTGLIDVAGGTRTWFSQIDDDGQVKLDGGALTLAAVSPNSDAGAWNVTTTATLTLSASRTLGASGALGGAGTLVVNSGTTTVPNGATLNPAVLTLSGGVLNVDGTAPASTLPQVNLSGGTLGGTRNRSITNLAAQSGTLSGAQTTTVSGSFVKSTAGQLSVTGGISLRPTIDTTWSAGDVCINNGSTFRIQNELDIAAGAGSFNCSSNDSLVQVTQTALIDVAGGTRTWFSQVDNDGQVKLDAGTLTQAAVSPNTDAGAWNIAAPSTLTLSASRTVAGALGGAGTLVVNSGTTTVPNGATLNPAVLSVSGGVLNADGAGPALTLPTVNLSGGTLGGTRSRSIGTLAATSGTLTGAQTSTVTGSLVKSSAGQLSVNGGITVHPTVDMSWVAGDICISGGSTLQLDHKLDVIGGAGAFNCSSADSLVDVLAGGSVDLAGPPRTWFSRVRNAGAVAIDSGESLTFAGGFDNVTGGTLTGSGTVGGAIANSGGVVKPGSSPGRLTINGTYTQGATGTLEVDLNGTTPGSEFDQLAVSGAATLAGTLAIVRLASFDPPVATTFQVVTSGSRTGNFAAITGATFNGKEFSDSGATPGFRLAVVSQGVIPPPVAGTPVVSGTVAVGRIVTCAEGSWTGSPTFAYQWLRDGAPIAGAVARTYAIPSADATHRVACRVTGKNGGGSAQATSLAVTVPPVAPQVASDPVISGAPAVGRTLTCSPGTFTGIPTPALTFAWLRDGTAIAGETDTTYRVRDTDANHTISCRVTATNVGGSAIGTSRALNVPKPLAGATPGQIATAFGLPSADKCVGHGTFTVRLHEPEGISIRFAQVFFNGDPVPVKKKNSKWVARINLRHYHRQRFTVKIKVKATDKRAFVGKRTYRLC